MEINKPDLKQDKKNKLHELILGVIAVNIFIGISIIPFSKSGLLNMAIAAGIAGVVFRFMVPGYYLSIKPGKKLNKAFKLDPVKNQIVYFSIGIGILLGIGAMFLSRFYEDPASPMHKITETTGGLIFVSVIAILGAPVEEIYFRRFILDHLSFLTNKKIAGLIVILGFTVLHGGQLNFNVFGLLVILVLSSVLTLQKLYYNSLIPSIITHLCYNAMLVITSIIYTFME